MEKVLCPWCGAEMTLEEGLPYSGIYAYVCECGAVSPNEEGKEQAFQAALARSLQKPMTLDEMKEQKAVWIETDVVFPALLNINDDAYNAFIRSDGDCFVEKTKLYGRCWRCWAMKPTDAEREAAKWE